MVGDFFTSEEDKEEAEEELMEEIEVWKIQLHGIQCVVLEIAIATVKSAYNEHLIVQGRPVCSVYPGFQ